MSPLRSDKLTQSWSRLGIEPEHLAVNSKGTVDPPPPEVAPEPLEELTASLPPLASGPWREEIQRSEQLAEGGNAIISIATQASLSREVVVKELKPAETSPSAALALLQEGYVLGALQHPNVVPAHLVGRNEQGRPMLVLKRVEGTQWRNYVGDGEPLEAPDEDDDPLVWNLGILMQVCNAVHYAHSQRIVHRDIKPENVMIGEFGEVYLMDWGLAVSLFDRGDERIPLAKDIRHIVGTPEYMAPEMALGDGSGIDERTDVYLLGACLHELLTGYPPHDGETITEALRMAFSTEPYRYADDVPSELVTVCQRAMHSKSGQRYADAEAMRAAIGKYLTHRAATRLSDEAAAHERELDTLFSASSDADPVAIYRRFGACRFGYRQALREWPDNALARRGLQELLERMAQFEIDRDAPDAASVLIAELPEPRTELEEQVQKLRERLTREQNRRQQVEREADLDQGKRVRRRLMASICILFALSLFAFGSLDRAGVFHPRWGSMLVLTLLYGTGLSFGLFHWREPLSNQANRRFAGNLASSVIGPLLLWPVAWHLAMPVPVTLGLTALVFGVVAVSLTLATHPRLLWAAAPFALAFIGSALHPSWAFEWLGAAFVVAMGLLALLWRTIPSYNVAPPSTSR